MYYNVQDEATGAPIPAFLPLLSDEDLAGILGMTTAWVRSHASELPGLRRLGCYYRFCRHDVEQWLGSLEPLLDTARVAELLQIPESWVYANADEIPGLLRLGRYVRFRAAMIRSLLNNSKVVQ
jgi:predicted DNA-binding transcriptional regulator AlpA